MGGGGPEKEVAAQKHRKRDLKSGYKKGENAKKQRERERADREVQEEEGGE